MHVAHHFRVHARARGVELYHHRSEAAARVAVQPHRRDVHAVRREVRRDGADDALDVLVHYYHGGQRARYVDLEAVELVQQHRAAAYRVADGLHRAAVALDDDAHGIRVRARNFFNMELEFHPGLARELEGAPYARVVLRHAHKPRDERLVRSVARAGAREAAAHVERRLFYLSAPAHTDDAPDVRGSRGVARRRPDHDGPDDFPNRHTITPISEDYAIRGYLI